MNQYKKLLRKLSAQTGLYAAVDGFPSDALRRAVLNEVRTIILDAKPHGEPSHFLPLNATEQLRAEYIHKAGFAGAAAAGTHAAGLIRDDTPEYLRELIVAGAQAIGRRIGRGYAAELYPELRRLQIAAIPVMGPAEPELVPGIHYTFTVVNYGNCREIIPVEPTRRKPGSEIFHDGVNDRRIETFVFATVEEADNALGAWERHNRDDRYPPPFHYGIVIETEDATSVPEVGSIVHVPCGEENSVRILENGVRQETLVFSTIEEAEKSREERLRRNHKTVPPPKEKTIDRKPEPTRSIPPAAPEPSRREEKKHRPIGQ